MSNEDKSRVAAAQLLIDDEPDDWYVVVVVLCEMRRSDLGKRRPALSEANELTQETRDKRIYSTGCADENTKLTDCYYEKKDWRACKQEVSFVMACLRYFFWILGPRSGQPRRRRHDTRT
jgi:cytochrome c oxidase assembly factor 4